LSQPKDDDLYLSEPEAEEKPQMAEEKPSEAMKTLAAFSGLDENSSLLSNVFSPFLRHFTFI